MNRSWARFIFGIVLGLSVMAVTWWKTGLKCTVDFCDIFYYVNVLRPYDGYGFVNPPWGALFFAPLLPLGKVGGSIAIGVINVVVIALLIHKKKGGVATYLAIFTSMPFIQLMLSGNIEFVPILGYMLGWPILLLVKPQSGIFIVLKWLGEIKRLQAISASMVLVIISFVIWRNWPFEMYDSILRLNDLRVSTIAQYSFWPYTIVIGLFALAWGLLKKDEFAIIASSWFIFPHVYAQSMLIGLVVLGVRKPALAFLVSCCLYLAAALAAFL